MSDVLPGREYLNDGQIARAAALNIAREVLADKKTAGVFTPNSSTLPVSVADLVDVAEYVVAGTRPVSADGLADMVRALADLPMPSDEQPEQIDPWGVCEACQDDDHGNCGGDCDCPDLSH